ncbi:hypothetical protein [Anaerococcus vaginimassiliensis]|uniref:hypothetical protein n=1 Tax=Anaerococcus vaginimassiliensis TaxID=2042308 RepID=UPI00102FE4D7|nr:hypothetical protein [Anaerococcus vaginimassiliensis]
MKIEFTNDEMAVLTAIILAMSEDVEKGMFDQEDVEMAERAQKSFTSLSNKVLMANFKLVAEMSEGVMDAEILDEEE